MLTYSIEDFHRYFCCCARRVGSMFILKERQDGSPLVIAGPCWPFCTFVTVPLIVVLSSLVAYFIVLNEDSGLVSLVGCCHFHVSCQGGDEDSFLPNNPVLLNNEQIRINTIQCNATTAVVVCIDLLTNNCLRVGGTVLCQL